MFTDVHIIFIMHSSSICVIIFVLIIILEYVSILFRCGGKYTRREEENCICLCVSKRIYSSYSYYVAGDCDDDEDGITSII